MKEQNLLEICFGKLHATTGQLSNLTGTLVQETYENQSDQETAHTYCGSGE
jgi:hypothetical protein